MVLMVVEKWVVWCVWLVSVCVVVWVGRCCCGVCVLFCVYE